MINMTKLSMTLNFTQCHRVTKQNLFSRSVVKWHEVAQTFSVIDHVREMTSKKTCMYGEYGLCECRLFMLCFVWHVLISSLLCLYSFFSFRSSNPCLHFQTDFPPDLCSRVTFVNFTVTRSSLQSQCLNQVNYPMCSLLVLVTGIVHLFELAEFHRKMRKKEIRKEQVKPAPSLETTPSSHYVTPNSFSRIGPSIIEVRLLLSGHTHSQRLSQSSTSMVDARVWFQSEWPWCSLKVPRLWESLNLCSHSVVKLHKATEMFMMVNYVRGMTVKTSCKYGW